MDVLLKGRLAGRPLCGQGPCASIHSVLEHKASAALLHLQLSYAKAWAQ